MVEQLLKEQKNLKHKIIQQERILESHLSKNDEQSSTERGSLSNRNSSREFKIRKSKGSKEKLQTKVNEDLQSLNAQELEKEILNKNVILNH